MIIKSEILKRIQLSSENHYHNILGTPVDVHELKKQLEKGELKVPDDAIHYSTRMIMERDFLNYGNLQQMIKQEKPFPEQGWMRIFRLPVSPVESETYALYPRWQNAISILHALELRLCYVLLRSNGETKLFLGAIPMKRDIDSKEARERLNLAISSQIQGIGVENIDQKEIASEIMGLDACGAVTGIPSTRKITKYGEYQTIDQIAMGLRSCGEEKNFAIVINAEPVPDTKIVDVLRTMENLGSEVHALTQYSRTEGRNSSTTITQTHTSQRNGNFSVDVGGSVGVGIKEIIDLGLKINVNDSVRYLKSTTNSGTVMVGTSDSVSMHYISKSAMYCEELFDKHIERMKAGRNLGFWKTGVYVLAEDNTTAQTVMGMLRAVYSGDNTYIEPIRITLMPHASGAAACVKVFRHIPYPYKEAASILGSLYQDYATPLTTEELSIAASLPRKGVQ